MATVISPVADICRAAKRAARELARTDTAVKDAALLALAAALEARLAEILEANERDMQAGEEAEIGAALLDRLRLDRRRVTAIAQAVRQIAALADPVGEVIDGRRLPNGLDVRKVRVPLGVIAVVYEARPNVTVDAAALCLKSGNAIVLRGSSIAAHSNATLAQIAAETVVASGLPESSVSLVAGGGHDELAELATQADTVDLIIPRGGEGLKAALSEVATVPVIYAASGNCHVYVDASADLDQAEAIVINSKAQRPGVCNAAETLLVHSDVAGEFLPRVLRSLGDAGVLVRADRRTLALAGAQGGVAADEDAKAPSVVVEAAEEEDWASEYLALTIAVKVVDSVGEAVEHIARYGSGHSEAIVTRDTAAARGFQLGVDAACVYVNASTRFTDGGEFGMGAEIGNSTQKLHARGPIGLRELCTFKYLIEGDGHVRGEQPVELRSVGILGGTFNPPHLGHLALALHALGELGLEGVVMMPAHISPHKPAEEDPGTRHRLAMCRLLVAGTAGLSVCPLEIERAGPSYTVDTMEAIHASHPGAQLTFIVGADTAGTLPAWREPAKLLGLADLAVAARAGSGRKGVLETVAPLLAAARPAAGDPTAALRFLDMPAMEVSSSMARERAARGEPIEDLVGGAVAGYIADHGLYRDPGGGRG